MCEDSESATFEKDLVDPDGKTRLCSLDFDFRMLSQRKCSKSTGSDPVESPGNIPGENGKSCGSWCVSWSEVLEEFLSV